MKKDEEKSTEFMHGSSTCIGQRNGGDGSEYAGVKWRYRNSRGNVKI